MNRRSRSPQRFGRNVRQRIHPRTPILWRFDSDHINGGPADEVPITIRATPIDVPGTPTANYIAELASVFQLAMIFLVRRYGRARRLPRMTDERIRDLPIFFFPTDVLFI